MLAAYAAGLPMGCQTRWGWHPVLPRLPWRAFEAPSGSEQDCVPVRPPVLVPLHRKGLIEFPIHLFGRDQYVL